MPPGEPGIGKHGVGDGVGVIVGDGVGDGVGVGLGVGVGVGDPWPNCKKLPMLCVYCPAALRVPWVEMIVAVGGVAAGKAPPTPREAAGTLECAAVVINLSVTGEKLAAYSIPDGNPSSSPEGVSKLTCAFEGRR